MRINNNASNLSTNELPQSVYKIVFNQNLEKLSNKISLLTANIIRGFLVPVLTLVVNIKMVMGLRNQLKRKSTLIIRKRRNPKRDEISKESEKENFIAN